MGFEIVSEAMQEQGVLFRDMAIGQVGVITGGGFMEGSIVVRCCSVVAALSGAALWIDVDGRESATRSGITDDRKSRVRILPPGTLLKIT